MAEVTMFSAISTAISPVRKALRPIDSRSGWWPLIREPYAGAWQKNDEITVDTSLSHFAVFACITLIASDIAKLRARLVELGKDGIWDEAVDHHLSAVLRRPNRFQNHIQFKENWMISKLSRGNTYGLKERDKRGALKAIYLLDPCRVTPLVSDDGSIYYELKCDRLAGVPDGENVVVPASEIIHDRMNCLFHPLVGISPLYASSLAANQGIKIQGSSTTFFGNGGRPGGVLTAPGAIAQETADRLKAHWDANYTGENFGKVAVLGDGLKFEPMSMTAIDSQTVEQLKMTAEIVCSTFHVPPFKLGIGSIPAGQKVEDLNAIYYADCLQKQIEDMELCLDEGLGIGEGVKTDGRMLGVELDLDALLRMDTATQMKTWGEGVGYGVVKPNEARRKFNLRPVGGGDTPYLQQQNYSLSALDERDRNKPFAAPAVPAAPDPEEDQTAKAISLLWSRKPETLTA